MESYILITQLNDFIFCPRSIYFHNVYQQNYSTETYHKTWQKKGQAAHKAIDEQTYSSRKDILQGIDVYSHKYNLAGKIDVLDLKTGELCERKYSVTKIYDGFRYQVYAQYFALIEMGYEVKSLKIYSKKDNKNYPLSLPNKEQTQAFEATVQALKDFDLTKPFKQNPRKCKHCIYNPLCDIYQEDEL